MLALSRLRWSVTVGGDQHLPRRNGALIVVNARRFALAPIFAAFAISEAVDRPVRFVGRSDTAPLGPFARRIGGLLDHPDEVFGALRAGELGRPRRRAEPRGLNQVGDVGRIKHEHRRCGHSGRRPGVSGGHDRAARSGAAHGSRSARRRGRAGVAGVRSPNSNSPTICATRSDDLLDEMGEIRTGTPIDWLPLSGLGGH